MWKKHDFYWIPQANLSFIFITKDINSSKIIIQFCFHYDTGLWIHSFHWINEPGHTDLQTCNLSQVWMTCQIMKPGLLQKAIMWGVRFGGNTVIFSSVLYPLETVQWSNHSVTHVIQKNYGSVITDGESNLPRREPGWIQNHVNCPVTWNNGEFSLIISRKEKNIISKCKKKNERMIEC